MNQDSIRRFLFDGSDVRGEIVCLETAYAQVLAPRQDPPAVAGLLGEFLAAASLLASTLKFEGLLTLQVRSNGEVPLLIAETTHDRGIRGIVSGAENARGTAFRELVGDGTLAMTVEPRRGERYQGIVPLEGDSLALCLDAYFARSEQLPTRLWLAADGRRAAGLLLQALPAQETPDPALREEQWQHLCLLADTVKPAELLQLDPETVLYRLFHQEPVRLLGTDPVQFRCSCSRERTARALAGLGETEVRDILAERGAVEMRCEFCHHAYRFGPTEIEALFHPAGPTLH